MSATPRPQPTVAVGISRGRSFPNRVAHGLVDSGPYSNVFHSMTRWLQSLQFRLSMARIDNEQKAVSALCHPGKGGQLACYCYASPLGSTHSSPSTLVLLCVSKHRIKQDPDVFYFTPGRDTRQHIAYHGLHCTLSVSLFTFLRYKPPPRIRGSRRVIADADDFLITRIGRGSFASIARVLRRSSGETRVMKRIAIDNSGLSQVLAQAEIDALEAVRGLPWFPYLMNHFSDGEDHVLTMASILYISSRLRVDLIIT